MGVMVVVRLLLLCLVSVVAPIRLPFTFQDDEPLEGRASFADEIVNYTDINLAAAGIDDDEQEEQVYPTARSGTPEFLHHNLLKPTSAALDISKKALQQIKVEKELQKKFKVHPDDFRRTLGETFSKSVLKDTCIEAPTSCSTLERYRSMDGSCNNLNHTVWGQAFTPLQRLLPSVYSDGVWESQKSWNGSSMPSARDIRVSIAPDRLRIFQDKTTLLTFWGQFVDHDLTFVPIFGGEHDEAIRCCQEDGSHIDAASAHISCMPINISKSDPFFKKWNHTCMQFVRSIIAPKLSCRLGSAEQLNTVTTYLDASVVYGSSYAESSALRQHYGGQLRSTWIDGQEMPPFRFRDNTCEDHDNFVFCFSAGDERANEQPILTMYHVVWLRRHNQLARRLSKLNDHWDDERLYQEARRIVAAEIQHITYNHFLPIILGKNSMESYGLHDQTQYNRYVNPSISNEFASVAFRFGHSLIQASFMLNSGSAVIGAHSLRSQIGKPTLVYTKKKLLSLLEGALRQAAMFFDNSFTEELTNHLFEDKKLGLGLDLIALDIQRARDHGIGSYNHFRRLCRFPVARTFQDFSDHISQEGIGLLEDIYKHVDDVELYAAGIMEQPLPGTAVGPIFHCILVDQFARLRIGDRFFHDVAGQPGSFSKEQVQSVQRTSLATIFCQTTTIAEIQRDPFLLPSSDNPISPCKYHGDIDLQPWQEHPHLHQDL